MVAAGHPMAVRELDESFDPPAIVEIEKISRRFGSKLALDEVSFRVPAGTVVGQAWPLGWRPLAVQIVPCGALVWESGWTRCQRVRLARAPLWAGSIWAS